MSNIILQEKKSERIKTSEIVKEYKISRTTLWRLDKQGKLKPVGRTGQDKVYLRQDVEDYQTSMLCRFDASCFVLPKSRA